MATTQVVERPSTQQNGTVSAPIGMGPAPSPGRAGPPHALVRRRRVVLVFAGLTAAALLVAIGSGAAAAWWAVAGVALVAVAYLALLHHVRRVAAEHEFASLLGRIEIDLANWTDLGLSRTDDTAPPQSAGPVGPRPVAEAWAVARFAFAQLAGWALSPVVFALTLLARERPRDATGQRWLAALEATQEHLRERSLRTLAISAATTASVTAAGTVAALTGAGTPSAASLPASTLLPTAAPAGATYRVVAGDTLGSIAARFGTTIAALASINHIADPDLIYPGQLIIISGASGTGRSWGPPAGSTYRVVAGDTLGSIAARFGTTIAALASINHIADPNLIIVGQVLAISGSGGGGGSTGGGGSWGPPAGSSYRVAAGDTLGSIAARFGTTIAALATINHIADPNLIYVGQMLIINGSGRDPAPSPPPPPAPAPAPASAGQVAAAVARQQVGKPYQYGGAGPSSFDCSGLVQYAWGKAGVYLPHYSVSQYQDTQRISESQLQPGDLVFYDTGGGAQPGHVTIYVGGGQIVTADTWGTNVRVEPVDWDGIPMGFGRVG